MPGYSASFGTIKMRNILATFSAFLCIQTDPATTVPPFRAYSAADDHLYTASAAEIQGLVSAGTYTNEGTVARVFATQELGTVPFYHFYSTALTDHFYTITESEGLNAGYTAEGIVGYVYPGTAGSLSVGCCSLHPKPTISTRRKAGR
ncbi:hypothetical protein DXG01_004596 [Tephrocybe rancida]|nr:hypothetical protein DXG01_004596 [Tephrocybe rancida]